MCLRFTLFDSDVCGLAIGSIYNSSYKTTPGNYLLGYWSFLPVFMRLLCVYPCLHPDHLWSPVTFQVIIIPWAGLLVVRFTLKLFSRLHGFRFQVSTLTYFRALILVFYTFSRWSLRSFGFRSWCLTVISMPSARIVLFPVRFQSHPTPNLIMIISHSFCGQNFSSKAQIVGIILKFKDMQ